mmetsp:Transcript_23156/g.34753  ORF Transcript_23156/g.34753 Transcript_23156/m.34753 type:complete len:105 (-) Transcript_23156:1086-1400(-)
MHDTTPKHIVCKGTRGKNERKGRDVRQPFQSNKHRHLFEGLVIPGEVLGALFVAGAWDVHVEDVRQHDVVQSVPLHQALCRPHRMHDHVGASVDHLKKEVGDVA